MKDMVYRTIKEKKYYINREREGEQLRQTNLQTYKCQKTQNVK